MNPEPHPFSGYGSPAREVAQVLAHGTTDHALWVRQMGEAGITSFMQLGYEAGQRLMATFARAVDSRSELSSTVAALRRAEREGLVVRRQPLTARGKPCGMTFWQAA